MVKLIKTGGSSWLQESGWLGFLIRVEGSSWKGDSTTGESGTDAGQTAVDVEPKKGAKPKYGILASGGPSCEWADTGVLFSQDEGLICFYIK